MEFWNRRFYYLGLFFRVSSLKRVCNPDQRGSKHWANLENKKRERFWFHASEARWEAEVRSLSWRWVWSKRRAERSAEEEAEWTVQEEELGGKSIMAFKAAWERKTQAKGRPQVSRAVFHTLKVCVCVRVGRVLNPKPVTAYIYWAFIMYVVLSFSYPLSQLIFRNTCKVSTIIIFTVVIKNWSMERLDMFSGLTVMSLQRENSAKLGFSSPVLWISVLHTASPLVNALFPLLSS